MNKRKVAVLLAAAMFFTSLPFGNGSVYASVLKSEGAITADEIIVPYEAEAVLQETDDENLIVNDDLRTQDDLLLQDEEITEENEADSVAEYSDTYNSPSLNDSTSEQENTDETEVSNEGAVEAEASPEDGWFVIENGSLKGAQYRFEDGKLTVSGNVTPDDATSWNTDVEEQGSPIPHGDETGAIDITEVKSVEIHIKGAKDLGLLFAGFTSLEEVDFYGCDTENVESICGMFYGCSALAYVDLSPLDLRYIHFSLFSDTGVTSDVGGFDYVFEGCSSLDQVVVAEEGLPDVYYGQLITLPYDVDHVWKNERLSKYVGGIEKDPTIDSYCFGYRATYNSYKRIAIEEANADTQFISALMHQGAYVTINLPTNKPYKSGNKINWTADQSRNKIVKLYPTYNYKDGNALNASCRVEYIGKYDADEEYSVVHTSYGDKVGSAVIRFINPLDYSSGSGCAQVTAEEGSASDWMYISSLYSGQVEFYKSDDEDSIDKARENGIPYVTWDADDSVVEDAYFEFDDRWVDEIRPETMAEGYVSFTLKENASPGRTTVMTTLHVMDRWTRDGYSYFDYNVPFYIDVIKASAVSTPTASIASGTTVKNGTRVMLECATPGAEIIYLIDDDQLFEADGEPRGIPYSGPIKISEGCTVYAAAWMDGFKNSEIAEFDYGVYDDWGDIGEESYIFDDISSVPDGIWFLISENDEWSYCENGGDTGIERTFTGSPVNINKNVRVFCGTKKLLEDKDYTVKYSDNTDAGTAAMTVSGKGNFSGSAKITFNISPVHMADATVRSGSVVTIEPGKSLDSFKPEVTLGDRKLTLNKDYECEYKKDGVVDPISGKTKAVAGDEYLVNLKPKNINFTGTKEHAFTIKVIAKKDGSKASMSSVKVTVPKLSWDAWADKKVKVLFDNDRKNAVAVVKNGNKTLVYGTDFVLENEEAVIDNAGSFDVILKGTEGKNGGSPTAYYGSKKAVVTVNGIKASKVKVGGMASEVEYKGRPLILEDLNATTKGGYKGVTLSYGEELLRDGSDYDVEFNNNGAPGKAYVVFRLKGKYEGTITKKITIVAADVNSDRFSCTLNGGTGEDVGYSKSGAVPAISFYDCISDDGMLLKEGVDYTVSYKNNTKIGQATALIKGKGNYTGTYSVAFSVVNSSPDALEVVVTDKIDNGKKGGYKQVPKLMEGGKKLSKGKDVDALPGKNDWKYFIASTGEQLFGDETVPSGTVIMVCADVTISPSSPYYNGDGEEKVKATVKGYYRVIDKDHDISKAKVTVDDNEGLEFNNGEELLPDNAWFNVQMKDGKFYRLLKENEYEVVSVDSNRFIGTATVTLRGKGEYGGTKKVKVKVKPRRFDDHELLE